MRAAGTRAIAALRLAGVAYQLHPYETAERHGAQRDDRPAYGLDAASSLGLTPAQIFKTLVVVADGVFMLAIVSVDRTLDLKRFAAAAGAHRAAIAETRDAERVTGYIVGGISPIGTTRPMRTVLDASATDLDRVYVSAGRRGLQVSLLPADLVAVTGAAVATISVEGR